MNLAEAKKLIATYLTGQPVSQAALRKACEAVESDEEYTRYLKSELGLSEELTTGCEVFLSHVAEFGDLSREERRREFPELERHVETCRRCRGRYWNVKPLWVFDVAEALGEKARLARVRLAEGIQLVLGEGERLIERGLGPLPIEHEFVAVTMSGDVEAGRKEWLLEDHESGCAIRLVVFRDISGQPRLSCSLESETGAPAPDQIQIEICKAATGSQELVGRLSDFLAEPLFIGFGSRIVRLEARVNDETRIWEIPIEIERTQA